MTLPAEKEPRKWFFRRWFDAVCPNHLTLIILFLVLVTGSLILSFWDRFLHHVPSGHMLVVISKWGETLPEGQILAKPGQKGIQEKVRGEGWHLVWPILYVVEIKPNIEVPGARWTPDGIEPARIGIVKALDGTPLPPGQFLAKKGQQGIWREILLPGSYRLNPYGFQVALADMVEIKQGFVGVKRRKLGEDGLTEFATQPNEKGIIKDEILQPGLYAVNTEQYEIIPCEVGIYQTTYHYSKDPSENTALVIDASDSNRIQIDCSIEWELKPQFWPVWLSKFRNRERIETTFIKPNVKNISRNKGQNYGAKDFLDGALREKFQTGFMDELREVCEADHIIIRNALIRNIIIPEAFLKPKREEQLAREKALTQKEQTLTAETQNDVVEAESNIAFEVAKVKATTERLVAAIEQEVKNIGVVTDAEIEQMKDEYSARIAKLEAQRTQLVGEADAKSKELVGTAKDSLHRMKMDVFNQDGEAFLRYSLAESLNPQLRLRLFQSGAGTLWTNMGNKDFNLFMPVPGK